MDDGAGRKHGQPHRPGSIRNDESDVPGPRYRSYPTLAPFVLPPYPRGGSANTTNNTRFGVNDFYVRGGASFRMVVDVGNWDAATATNAPGQAGDPRSPFYDNLLENWATEGDFPLLYSDEAVAEATAFTIRLVPPPRPVMQGTSPR